MKRIAFIKCDVEGHELRCLAGAQNLIARCRPAWLVEISGNPDDRRSESHQVFQMFQDYGYSPFLWYGNTLYRRQPGDANVNYFFLTPEHIRLMTGRGLKASLAGCFELAGGDRRSTEKPLINRKNLA